MCLTLLFSVGFSLEVCCFVFDPFPASVLRVFATVAVMNKVRLVLRVVGSQYPTWPSFILLFISHLYSVSCEGVLEPRSSIPWIFLGSEHTEENANRDSNGIETQIPISSMMTIECGFLLFCETAEIWRRDVGTDRMLSDLKNLFVKVRLIKVQDLNSNTGTPNLAV